MEIPIQVAVRIRPPQRLLSRTPATPARKASDAVNNNNNNNADDDNDANDNAAVVCVKSIPGTFTNTNATNAEYHHLAHGGDADDASVTPLMSTPGFIQVEQQQQQPHDPDIPITAFPYAYALPLDCSQDLLYMQCVYPMLGMYLEGFDASFVTYGQCGTGKTYTMLGNGIDDGQQFPTAAYHYEGIVQRCVRDIFALLSQLRERNYVLNIGWVEVWDHEIHDLLDYSGNVPCQSAADVFHWLRVGVANRAARLAEQQNNEDDDDDDDEDDKDDESNARDRSPRRRSSQKAPPVHSIFTLTLEQHWVADGLIQHRLSTASFCDLAGTARRDLMQRDANGTPTAAVLAEGVCEDAGLQVLDEIVDELSAAAVIAAQAYNGENNAVGANNNSVLPPTTQPPYTNTTLTTLLKDSFGGRAKTLLILCVSALQEDIAETLHNLRFAQRAQCVRNFVVLNAFSDNNTPLAAALAAAAAAAAVAAAASTNPSNQDGGGGMLGCGGPLDDVGGLDGIGGLGMMGGLDIPPLPGASNAFGLQFAATQWLKLVSNAEGLFSRLIASKSLGDKERQRIEEWMFLKQECQDCLSSGEMHLGLDGDEDQRHLGPIQEEPSDAEPIDEDDVDDDDDDDDDDNEDVDDEDDDDDDDDIGESVSCQQNTDSDSESQQLEYLQDRMAQLMDEFRPKVDAMVNDKYEEFINQQPDAVMDSLDNQQVIGVSATEKRRALPQVSAAIAAAEDLVCTSPAPRTGRRKSIQPGENRSLTSRDIAHLNAVVAASAAENAIDINAGTICTTTAAVAAPFDTNTTSTDDEFMLLRSLGRDPLEKLNCELRKIRGDIVAAEQQASELQGTVETTLDLVQTLSKRVCSQNKVGFNKKRAKLEADYLKAQKVLNKAVASKMPAIELERLRLAVVGKKEMYAEFVSLNCSEEHQRKCKQHQKVLKASKKKLDALQKVLKKSCRRETEMLEERARMVKAQQQAAVAAAAAAAATAADQQASVVQRGPTGKTTRDVDARITQLDQVIREKALTLKQYGNAAAAAGDTAANADNSNVADRDLYRHEIRQLRRTRDQLVDERCTIDRKQKRDKRLTADEQRKLFECDESIEAIDAAIEYKNELICGGRRSIDTTSEAALRGGAGERGGRMMMARLNSLSMDEMRVLLYKYFQKAIDFRDNSVQMERDRDHWEMKARQLHHEVQRVRYESERRAALLHQQQEAKLAMYMRHINDNAMGDSSLSSTMTTSNDAAGGGGVTDRRMLAALAAANATTTTTTALVHRQQQQQQQQESIQNQRHLQRHQHHHHQQRQVYFDASSEVEMAAALPSTSGATGVTTAAAAFMAPAQYAQYKPLDKYKADGKAEQKTHSSSKFFSKMMFKTQYRGTTSTSSARGSSGAGTTAKVMHSDSTALTLPGDHQLQRHLHHGRHHVTTMATTSNAATTTTFVTAHHSAMRTPAPVLGPKVTREKNKLVIQQQH